MEKVRSPNTNPIPKPIYTSKTMGLEVTYVTLALAKILLYQPIAMSRALALSPGTIWVRATA